MARSERQLKQELLAGLAECIGEEPGWRASLDDAEHYRLDLLADRGDERLALKLNVHRDARQQALRPLLAEAMLAASVGALHHDDGLTWLPLAMVGAPHLTDGMLKRLQADFDELCRALPGDHAGKLGWGGIDATGRILIESPQLSLRRTDSSSRAPSQPRASQPYTDRGQWVLKLLVASRLPPESLSQLAAETYTGSRALARAAGVSPTTAANVVRYLRQEGHLSADGDGLVVRRTASLLRDWKARVARPRLTLKAEFVLPTADPLRRLREGLRRLRGKRAHAAVAYVEPQGAGMSRKQPRACLAGLSACEAHAVSVVQGGVPTLYVDDLNEESLAQLGLRPAHQGSGGSVRLLTSRYPEAVFRAAVDLDGVACADLLQCWIDIGPGTPRWHEQQDALEKGPLAVLFEATPP